MEALIAIMITFIVALILFLKTKKTVLSLSIASMIMPAFVLYTEFLLPYQGGGASMWPIALVVSSCAGFISAALGIGIGFYIRKILKSKKA